MQEIQDVTVLLPPPRERSVAVIENYTSLEIKPKKPGILAELLTPNERFNQPPLDDLIVFGQGPVVNIETKMKPQADNAIVEVEAISWMKSISRAAGELKKAGVVKRIILTGGRTGGESYPSEAELMKKILMEEYGIPEEDIIVENKATNTLENLVYVLNAVDKNPEEHKKIGLLGADFHLARIRLLTKLFGINNSQAFSAESIFRLIAYKSDDKLLHHLLDRRLNPNDDLSYPESRLDWHKFQELATDEKTQQPSKSALKAKTYFEEFSGEEKKGIVVRMRGENQWTYGLLEIPAYWVGYLGYLDDEQKLRTLLSENFSSEVLKGLGINPKAPIENLRQELLLYTKGPDKGGKRTGPDSTTQDPQTWTPEVGQKL